MIFLHQSVMTLLKELLGLLGKRVDAAVALFFIQLAMVPVSEFVAKVAFVSRYVGESD